MLVAAAISGCAAYELWILLVVIIAVDPINYAVFIRKAPVPLFIPALFALLPLLTAVLKFGGGERSYSEKLALFNRVSWPLLGLLPACVWFPDSYWTMFLMLLFGGVVVFRACLSVESRWIMAPRRLSPRVGVSLALLLFVVGVLWGFHMQVRAFRTCFLLFQDWGDYASGYMKLAFGDHVRLIDYLVNAGHWNPLVNMVMTAALWCWPHENTIFLINSLLIISAVPLVYVLARRYWLPVVPAVMFAVLALINPVFSNQHLALFYGFHPIYFFIPVMFGFFYFQKRQSRAGMIATFALSLLIQETVMVFWGGYALYMICCQRKYQLGAALFVFAAISFYILSSVVMPMAYEYEHYSQMFHYSHLGDSVPEVALSFVFRPDVFWETAFSESNFLFAFSLLLPFFPVVLQRPKLLVSVLPLFVGVCLQGSRSLQTVVLQYGTEITVVCFVAAIAAVADCRRKDGGVPRLLSFRLPGLSSRRLLSGLMLAMLFTGVGSYFCFGKSFLFGKYSFAGIARLQDYSTVIDEVKKVIPHDREVRTQNRLRGHFLFDYATGEIDGKDDCKHSVLLNLNDDFDGNLIKVHRRLVSDRRYAPVLYTQSGRRQFVVFEFNPDNQLPKEPPFFIRRMTDEEFRDAGTPVESADPNFETSIMFDRSERALVCFMRIKRTIDYDVNIGVALRLGDAKASRLVPFGFGIHPAYLMCPGDVFILRLPLPSDWDHLDSAGIYFNKR